MICDARSTLAVCRDALIPRVAVAVSRRKRHRAGMKKLLAPSLILLSLSVVACSGGSAAGTYELDKAAVRQAMAAAMPADATANKEAAEVAGRMLDQMVDTMNGT